MAIKSNEGLEDLQRMANPDILGTCKILHAAVIVPELLKIRSNSTSLFRSQQTMSGGP